MMTMHKLADHLFAEPFRPFRIKLAGGQTINIRHGEMMSIGKSRVHIYANLNCDPDKPPQQHVVSMALIESVEAVDATLVASPWGI
jgi:hypothetical protein